MNPVFKTKRGGFHDPARLPGRRSAVLILTLAILTIITLMLIAFVAISTQDRGATQNYAQSLHAEQIGLGGLDQVVAQLQSEISDAGLSMTYYGGSSVPIYMPWAGTNAVPQRMGNLPASLPTLVKISTNEVFFLSGSASPANTGFASPSLTTTASLNGRKISASRWNKPQLLTTTSGFPVPNWVIVTRRGPQAFTSSSATLATLANSSLTNTSYAIGRYAYAVYDTSGLINVNVAGAPSGATSTNTGLVPFVDMTLLTNAASPAITTSDVDNLIKWRNAASYPDYPTYSSYMTNWATNGYMQVASGDTAFLSRQELIKYAQTQNSDLVNALPFLTTFSREYNAPSWAPTTNLGSGVSGTNNFNYATLAQPSSDSGSSGAPVTNPFFQTARVQSAFVRNNGTTAVPGEPLVKYRFALTKLNLLNKPYSSLSNQDLDDIARYFGLAPVTADASNTYHHWTYPITGLTALGNNYVHTAGKILTLNEVTAKNREPDFFELLQAGILSGSLGYYKNIRADYYTVATSSASDPDLQSSYQVLRIGANIIDQWKSDNFPTVVQFTPGTIYNSGSINIYGIQDLPYINQVMLKTYDEGSAAGVATVKVNGTNYTYGGSPGPWDYILYYEMWNPHQQASNTGSPNVFRVIPAPGGPKGSSGDCAFIRISDRSSGGGYWYWNNATQAWSDTTTLSPISKWYSPFTAAAFGGTNTFPAAATDYREPSLILNSAASPYASAYSKWTPTSPLSAIFLAQTKTLPPTNMSASTGVSWTNAVMNTNLVTHTPLVAGTGWEMGITLYATLLLQYSSDTNNPPSSNGGPWHTYSTWEGFDNGTNYYTVGPVMGVTSANQYASTNTLSFIKADPRTTRFGPSVVHNGDGTYTNAGPLPASTTQLADKFRTSDPVPFFPNWSPNATITSPYRMDMWSVNDSSVTINGANIGGAHQPWYQDNDGAYRGGDAKYSYASGHSPLISGDPASRPIILHRPFQSVGELGYVYRDSPWRTLDLFTPDSPDAALLDLFTLSDTPVVANRVNPNTPYANVIAALLSGAPMTNSAPTGIPASTAFAIGTAITNITAATPIVNRSGLVTSLMTNSAIASVSTIKTQREAVVRALAESANTRTWNFMIDIIAQSGNYPSNQTSPSLDNFMVTGERRYWLHIAIDRYTGQVVDKQLEVVNE